MTPLQNLILKNWREHHQAMYQQFVNENRLEKELETTEKQMSELLHQLLVIQKMDYHRAWEIVNEQFLLPEDASSSTSLKP